MKIDGSQIASELKSRLRKKVVYLHRKHIIPHLAVILVGDDLNSLIYVRQKEKTAKELGVKLSKFQIAKSANTKKQLIDLIKKLNKDKNIHGIIIQRPLPIDITKEELDQLVIPQKDVDGFHKKSVFTPPIAKAVLTILEWVFKSIRTDYQTFLAWLKKQKIVIIGRGVTAGKPIAETFKKMGITYRVAHSQTKNLKDLCLSSNIIISCVGGKHIVRQQYITNKSILIGVGLHRNRKGKLEPDYDQEKIKTRVKYYTPVPKGVGPVNVACLFENLIQATSESIKQN